MNTIIKPLSVIILIAVFIPLAAGIQAFIDVPGVNVGIIWPPAHHRIGLFTSHPRELKKACFDAAKAALAFFGRQDVEPNLL